MTRKKCFARIVAVSLTVVFAFVTQAVLSQQSAEEIYQSALFKKEAEGDLNTAIQLFQKIVTTFPENRALAAKAELQIGLCYEKLGLKQARDAFQRVVEKYPEQTDTVATAREKLSVLARAQTLIEKGGGELRIRKIPELTGGNISRDGRWLTNTDDKTGDLLVTEVATGSKRRLTNSASWARGDYVGYFGSVISPDSKRVAYFWVRGYSKFDLRMIGLDGSGERTLVSGDDTSPYAGAEIWPWDWTPDGRFILGITTKRDEPARIVSVSVSDGGIDLVKDLGDLHPERLKLSPDGRWIAYDVRLNPDSNKTYDIFLLSLDGSREIPLVKHPANDKLLGWTPGGEKILFASNRTGTWDAYIVPIEDGKARGEPALVTRHFGNVSSFSGAVPMGFTQDGSFYYEVRSTPGDVYIAVLDPENGQVSAPPQKVVRPFEGSNEYPAWSPDGKYLAYTSRLAALCLLSVDTGAYHEVLPKLSSMIRVSWFPDGESVVVVSGGIRRINVKTAAVQTLVTDGSGFHSPRCTPDGKKVLYGDDSWQDRVFRIMSYDVESGQKKEIYRSSQQIIRMDISADGKWLAFLEPADASLKVLPLEGGQPRVLHKFELEKGVWSSSVAWSPDGKYIYFPSGSGGKTGKMELWRIPASGGNPLRFDLAVDGMENLDIHPDGRHITFNSWRVEQEVWVMENFLPRREDD